MRTTITLDDEIAVRLKRIKKRFPEKSFKEIVNSTILKGLIVDGESPNVSFKIGPLSDTNPKPGLDFDNINALISQVEGDFHK